MREQLLKYVPGALQLSRLEVVYICSSEDAVSIVREEADSVRREHGANLHAVPLLRGTVSIGPAFEDQPDAWRPLFRPMSWLVEYERSAVDPAAIRDKLMPIVRVVQGGHRVAVIFICETELAAQRFEVEHQRLQKAHQAPFALLTSTYERVTAQAGRGTPWSLQGEPAHLI